MGKTQINVEDFYTEVYENEGRWFQPIVKGNPCGIEFLVTGMGKDENLVSQERYEKEMAKLEELKDPIEKVKKQKQLDAKHVASFIRGIRAAPGCEGMINGQPIEYSVPFIEEFMFNAPLIKIQIIKFARETTNFIKGEKNA